MKQRVVSLVTSFGNIKYASIEDFLLFSLVSPLSFFGDFLLSEAFYFRVFWPLGPFFPCKPA